MSRLPYDIDQNGIMDTPRSRAFIGASLKLLFEQYWKADVERNALMDIAEKIIGQRIFGYESHPVAKLSQLYTAWHTHMDMVYAQMRLAPVGQGGAQLCPGEDFRDCGPHQPIKV